MRTVPSSTVRTSFGLLAIWGATPVDIEQWWVPRITELVDWIHRLPQSSWSSDRRLSIVVFLTPFPKSYPADGSHQLDTCAINSGQTISYMDRTEIHIWRSEECWKVLIHELLHAFGWDRFVPSSSSSGSSPSSIIIGGVTIKNESEALVEAVARYLYLGWIANNQALPLLPFDQTLDALWTNQWQWSVNQWRHLRERPWTTTTNTVAYYPLTLALLSHPHSFYEWIQRAHTAPNDWIRIRNESIDRLGEDWKQTESENESTTQPLSLRMSSPAAEKLSLTHGHRSILMASSIPIRSIDDILRQSSRSGGVRTAQDKFERRLERAKRKFDNIQWSWHMTHRGVRQGAQQLDDLKNEKRNRHRPTRSVERNYDRRIFLLSRRLDYLRTAERRRRKRLEKAKTKLIALRNQARREYPNLLLEKLDYHPA